MNKEEFHIPFLQSMIIIAAVTLVSMASSRYFIEKYMFYPQKTVEYSSASFQNSTK
jgi:hypothetical protein